MDTLPAHEPDLIDWDDLKARIRDAIELTFIELADEHGLSVDEYIDWYFRAESDGEEE
jgi:hypothetical protein